MAFLDRYMGRISYRHFKDIDPVVKADLVAKRTDFHTACEQGIFCNLGQGDVDFVTVRQRLLDAGFTGWCTVEQDCDPSLPGSPLEDARANPEYLQSIFFEEKYGLEKLRSGMIGGSEGSQIDPAHRLDAQVDGWFWPGRCGLRCWAPSPSASPLARSMATSWVKTGLPSSIVTLATLFILRGFTIFIPQTAESKTIIGGIRDAAEGHSLAPIFGARIGGPIFQWMGDAGIIGVSPRGNRMGEPTSAPGVRQTAKVLATVDKVRKQGIAVVFITNNVRHAMAVADRFTVLNQGQTHGTASKGEITPEQLQDMMAGGQELAILEGSLGGTV